MSASPIESRFRVTICYPLGIGAPYHTTLNWLIKRLSQKYLGVTLSIHRPLPVFRGFYFSPALNRVVADRLVYIFTDAEIDMEHEIEDLERYLRAIKRGLHRRLPSEEEFWITYYPVTRIITPTRAESVPKDPTHSHS